MSRILRGAVATALLAAPLIAVAHHAEGYATPGTPIAGMLSGLAHPAIEIGQLAFLLALGVLCAGAPSGVRPVARFVAGSALGVAAAAAGWSVPAEPLLPLLLLGIAALLAWRGAGAASASPAAVGALLVAGFVHGQAAIEPMGAAAMGPFAAYAAAMLATQCAIVLATRAAIVRLVPADGHARRWGTGVTAAAAGLAAIAVALQPGLSLV
jgi:urease accessory protein